MNDNEAVADVLERAADLLWVRGRSKGPAGVDDTTCVLGAVSVVNGESATAWNRTAESPAASAFGSYLLRHPDLWRDGWAKDRAHSGWGVPGDACWLWNDATEDDDLVIDSLRRCAKELRA